jgi:serine/threonine protein kinase
VRPSGGGGWSAADIRERLLATDAGLLPPDLTDRDPNVVRSHGLTCLIEITRASLPARIFQRLRHDEFCGVGDSSKEHDERIQLREGMLVAGKYRLLEQRGEGAMGVVWSARHIALGNVVAIKFLQRLTGHSEGHKDARRRFAREARIAAQLGDASRHVVRVIDYGTVGGRAEVCRALSRFPAFGHPIPFLVMELLQGEDLAACLKREGRLPLERVASIVRQLARALHAAHAAGVVHRDLKPANIFLCKTEDDDTMVKLMDFGIAKSSLPREESTQTGMLVGTPGYMSPEQVLSGTVDHRSDLWALAACIYRMVVGTSPFGQGRLTEVAVRIVATTPPRPSQEVRSLPAAFDEFMVRALAKRPEDRFQSARELAAALDDLAGVSGDLWSSPRIPLPGGADSLGAIQRNVETSRTVAPRTSTRSELAPRPRSEPSWALPIAVVCALFAGGAITGSLLAHRRTELRAVGAARLLDAPVESLPAPAQASASVAASASASSSEPSRMKKPAP